MNEYDEEGPTIVPLGERIGYNVILVVLYTIYQ
jgi:hypothetical protein